MLDVLNSRNFDGINFHKPLSATTKDKYFKFLDEVATYIQELQIDDPIVNKKKKIIIPLKIPGIRSK